MWDFSPVLNASMTKGYNGRLIYHANEGMIMDLLAFFRLIVLLCGLLILLEGIVFWFLSFFEVFLSF